MSAATDGFIIGDDVIVLTGLAAGEDGYIIDIDDEACPGRPVAVRLTERLGKPVAWYSSKQIKHPTGQTSQARAAADTPAGPLVIPCATPALAEQFAAWLRGEDIDVEKTEARSVLIPVGAHPAFANGLAAAAVENQFAHDHEAAARRFETAVTGRKA